MSNTSLVLGTNWDENEWPDYVDVIHEPSVSHGEFSLSRKYVPELTCKMIRIDEIDMCECSNCQAVYDSWDGYDSLNHRYAFDYCQACGARVVD